MSVYKLAGEGTGGTQDGVGQLDIQADGNIVAISMCMTGDLDADQDVAKAEVSFISTNTFGVNDARGSLLSIRLFQIAAAAGTLVPYGVNNVAGVRIPVSAGERLWLHLEATASTPIQCEAYVYVEDGIDELRRRR